MHLRYPAAERQDIVEELSGHQVADPYRWLEDGNSPEVIAWSAAQTAFTEETLARRPGSEALRARIEALESELVEQTARANAAVVAAQERAYWLDRWHVDLNAIMRRRGATELRAALRALRSVVRRLRLAWRELRGSA
jgi:protease II